MGLFKKLNIVDKVKVNNITQMDNDITFMCYLKLKEDIEHMLNDDNANIDKIEISMSILEHKKKELLEIFAFRLDEDTKELAREIHTRRIFTDMKDNLEECKQILTSMNEQSQNMSDAYNTIKDGE